MRIFILLLSFVLYACGNTIFIVRHAEKASGLDMDTMKPSTDPPLTLEGRERSLSLKQKLMSRHFSHFFSTNTQRTIATASPLKEMFLGIPIELYSSRPDSLDAFIQRIQKIKKGDVLIVGHSNTVDDIVNKLAGRKLINGDLEDWMYDDLFILKRKGDTYQFSLEKYGKPSVEKK